MDVEKLRSTLGRQASVDDPFLGEGSAVAFEAKSMLWPGVRWSRIGHFATTEAHGRRLEEYRYTPADGGPVLPVAFMFEQAEGGERAYVYSDHHLVADREPILTPREGIHPWRSDDDVLFAYFKALNGNRIEDVLDLFEEDGYFRHSNDETFRGRDELRNDLSKMMGSSGIRIKYCRFTDDGRTCAVECYMPSGRPAIAVYERGTPGRLKAVRIYL